MEPRVGDTGTTPRNDYGHLMMSRANNMSFENRADMNLISPYQMIGRSSI